MTENTLFKTEANKFTNHKYVIGTFMGRYALYLALKTINVEKKEVLVPTFTCDVVINAIKSAGGIPVFIDINKNTFEMDASKIEEIINRKTKAIIIHHYFGNLCKNRTQIIELAKSKNIVVIEDCAWLPVKENNADIKIYSFAKTGAFCGGLFSTNSEKYYIIAKKILITQNSNVLLKLYKFIYFSLNNLQHRIDRLKDIPHKHIITSIYSIIFQLLRPILIINKIIGNWRHINSDDFSFKNYNSRISWDFLITKIQEKKAISEMKNYYKNKNCIIAINNLIKNKKKLTGDYIIITVKNIPKQINLAEKEKIYLRQTWPAIQKINNLQRTSNLDYIKNHILLFRISSHLTNKDIDKLKIILNRAQKYE